MNQGNNMNNNGTDATVIQTPTTQSTPVAPNPVQSTPVPAAVNNPTSNGLNFASAPTVSAPVQQVQEAPKEEVTVAPIQPQNNPQTVVAPTQTVINTTKKKGNNIFLFLVIILIGVFIYYIDDALAYFNQNHSPVVDTAIKENASANLIDDKYMKLNEENSYIKLKGIKFNNVRKSVDDTEVISYASDKNYSNVSNLKLMIELYDETKSLIYSEQFNVFGTIESGTTRQYKISLKTEVYDKVFYASVAEKTTEVVEDNNEETETTTKESSTTKEPKVIVVTPKNKEDNNG